MANCANKIKNKKNKNLEIKTSIKGQDKDLIRRFEYSDTLRKLTILKPKKKIQTEDKSKRNLVRNKSSNRSRTWSDNTECIE